MKDVPETEAELKLAEQIIQAVNYDMLGRVTDRSAFAVSMNSAELVVRLADAAPNLLTRLIDMRKESALKARRAPSEQYRMLCVIFNAQEVDPEAVAPEYGWCDIPLFAASVTYGERTIVIFDTDDVGVGVDVYFEKPRVVPGLGGTTDGLTYVHLGKVDVAGFM